VKLAFFAVFVLTLQIDFAARWDFCLLQMTLLLNTFANPVFAV